MQKSKKHQNHNIAVQFNRNFSKLEELIKTNQKKEIQNELSNLDIIDIERTFLDSYLKRRNEGVYFTSDKIARFIVEKSLLSLINNEMGFDLKTLSQINDLETNAKKKIVNILKEISICDPACGSGVFLYNAMIILYDILKKLVPNHSVLDLKTSIIINTFGLDINSLSLNLCKLKIYKWVLNENSIDNINLFNNINHNFREINSLTVVNWPKTIFNKNHFNLIIGNPPYGNILNNNEKRILKNEKIFSKDIYCTYLLKSLQWSSGIIGFLVPKSFLLRQSFIDLRNELFSKADILEIHDIGPNLFKKATNEVQIIIYKNKNDQNKELKIFNYPNIKINQYSDQSFDFLRICINIKCQMNVKSKKFFIYTFKEQCPYCNLKTQKLNRIRIKCDKETLKIIDKIESLGDINYLNIKQFPNFIRGEEAKGLKEIRKLLEKNNEGTCFFVNAKQDFSQYHFKKKKMFYLEKINPAILKGRKYEFYQKPKLLIKHNNIYPEAIFTKYPTCFTSSIYSLLYFDEIELKHLCAMLNSIIIQFYCIYGINNQKGTTINLNQYMIRHLPIVKIQDKEKKILSEKVDFITNQLEFNNGELNKSIKQSIVDINDIIFEYFSIEDRERELMINKVKEFNKYYNLIY
ncbi:MAG: SAM-dependent DNA methyltransferase [Candidatus Lokiarchaeota archaeon]|nr:SAM-dependent DNA methyltransferase [Candidatus Lokiarchaeota archaeon]